MNARRTRRSLGGMTLTELLVVILIIAALLAVAVPSFSSMLYSSEASMAESQLHAAMRGGRDAAYRASGRQDTAVVFAYEPAPGGGRLVMMPCVKVADYYDVPNATSSFPLREIFVPSDVIEPVQLPRHWMVRGYAPVNSIEGIWYEGQRYGQSVERGDWVFPESHFYLPGTVGEAPFRQTFMVRFVAGSGVVATQSTVPVMVFMPHPLDPPAFNLIGGGDVPELRALRLSNPRRYIQRIMAATNMQAAVKSQLIGMNSPDMVATKPVMALALYDEIKMADALKTRIDPDTGCLYQKHVARERPKFVRAAGPGGAMSSSDAEIGRFMNQWIEGDTTMTGGIQSREDGDEPEARLFTIDRYSGTLKRVETQP